MSFLGEAPRPEHPETSRLEPLAQASIPSLAGAWGTPQMPVYSDPTPSIVGRELLGPQMGRKVTQGLPEFDPIAFLDRAKLKAEGPSSDVIRDESSLPEDEKPAPLLDLSSGKRSGGFHLKVEDDSSTCTVHAGMQFAKHARSSMSIAV
jgi:hypothetical protein